MAKRLEVGKCEHCGMLVEALTTSEGSLVCCGTPMKMLVEGSTDAAQEKHVPEVEKTANGYKVKVGSVAHPMDEKHWIQWIELVVDGNSYTRFLNPGDAPEAEFCVSGTRVYAREYCNLHGLWKCK